MYVITVFQFEGQCMKTIYVLQEDRIGKMNSERARCIWMLLESSAWCWAECIKLQDFSVCNDRI